MVKDFKNHKVSVRCAVVPSAKVKGTHQDTARGHDNDARAKVAKPVNADADTGGTPATQCGEAQGSDAAAQAFPKTPEPVRRGFDPYAMDSPHTPSIAGEAARGSSYYWNSGAGFPAGPVPTLVRIDDISLGRKQLQTRRTRRIASEVGEMELFATKERTKRFGIPRHRNRDCFCVFPSVNV
jgi:hypothetical protein